MDDAALFSGPEDRRWFHSVVAGHIADILSLVATGQRCSLVSPARREFYRGEADAVVLRAVTQRFDDDAYQKPRPG